MDVGIACLLASSRAAVGLSRALAARLDGPGFAHWLTQQQSLRSESCRSIRVDRTGVEESREQRDSAGVKGRGNRPSHAPCPLIACLLSRRHARTRTPLRTIRTLDFRIHSLWSPFTFCGYYTVTGSPYSSVFAQTRLVDQLNAPRGTSSVASHYLTTIVLTYLLVSTLHLHSYKIHKIHSYKKNRVGDDGVPAILQYRPSDLYLTDRKETMTILQKGSHTPLHICK